MDMSLSKLQEMVKDREPWSAAVHGGHIESDMTKRMNWTELNHVLSNLALPAILLLGDYSYFCFTDEDTKSCKVKWLTKGYKAS